MTPKERYLQQTEMLTAEIKQLNKYNHLVIITELLAFALAVASLVAYTSWGGAAPIVAALLFLGAYMAIRWKDGQNSRLREEKERLLGVYHDELSYQAGDFSCFEPGEQYVDARHEFTFDLDIFGQQSLFQRINRTITKGGSDFLAHELSNTEAKTREAIEARREAIGELADKEPLRAAFLAQNRGKQLSTDDVLNKLSEVRDLHIPQLAASSLSLFLAVLSLAVFYGLLLGAIFGPLPGSWPLLWVILQLVAVSLLFGGALSRINRIIRVILPRLSTYVNMMILIAESDLKSEEAQDIINRLSAGDTDAVSSFRQLKGILNSLDQRNELWVPISNSLYLADYFIVRRFLKWQQNAMPHIEEWIAAVSHFDALVSMATFRYNETEGKAAEIIEADGVVYDAQGLYHPFLGTKAVRNDFHISDAHYYIITGANMAGKSTFLRAVGINYVLALCGLPVFARQLRVSRFALFSSMRTTDDLAHGISYFNAELLRLQQLINYCKQNSHTLIILDEILKGTNSLDKLNGSRLFLENVSTLPVTGIIATHDLELSRMEDANPQRFHNYCFEIQLSDDITYTYLISPGVARNQNATYLLKNILKETAL